MVGRSASGARSLDVAVAAVAAVLAVRPASNARNSWRSAVVLVVVGGAVASARRSPAHLVLHLIFFGPGRLLSTS